MAKTVSNLGGLAKKDRITHRFEITSLKDIDDEIRNRKEQCLVKKNHSNLA
jgi:hypothetical protein